MLLGELAERQLELVEDEVVALGEELVPAVQLVRFAPLILTAEVADIAHVELSVADGELHWFCTCEEGRLGVFCVHCVAATLARRHLLIHALCRRTDESPC